VAALTSHDTPKITNYGCSTKRAQADREFTPTLADDLLAGER